VAPVPDNETVLITLDYLKAKNIPSRGTVVFVPPRFTQPPDMIVTSGPCEVVVENGEASQRLIPSDAGTFQVIEHLDGLPPFSWHINLPSGLAGQTRSLFSFAPVQPIVQGVSVNTMLSGTGAPANSVGIDGDYYYDVSGKFWYGPKALGAWPAGFSVVGPAGTNGANGTNGTNGTNGAQGPPGAPGPRMCVVNTRITAGNVSPLPATGGLWKYPGEANGLPAYFTEQIQAAEGDYIEVDAEAMKNDVTNGFFDYAVRMGTGPYTYPWHASSGGSAPTIEGLPGWYRSDYATNDAPAGLYVTAAHIQDGFVRFVLANKSAGAGTLFASADYQFRWLLKNLGPAPA